MAAIIRVKRKRDEDPAEALILACKKRKDESGEKDNTEVPEITEVLKFAGTVASKDGSVSTKIRDAIRKEKIQKEYKRHSVDILSKARQHVKARSGRNRYRVIDSHRAIHLDSLDKVDVSAEELSPADKSSVITKDAASALSATLDSSSKDSASGVSKLERTQCELMQNKEKVFCLYDVENMHQRDHQLSEQPALQDRDTSTITCNSVPMIRECVPPDEQSAASVAASQVADFVYDLYYTNREGFDFRALQTILRIEGCGEMEFYDDIRDNPDGEVYDDEDDSNDEGNWRNDYPDEEPDVYDNDEDDFLSDEGMNANHLMVENGYSLEDYMASRCNLEDGEDLSSDEDLPPTGSAPHRSYETYLKSVRRGMEMEGEG